MTRKTITLSGGKLYFAVFFCIFWRPPVKCFDEEAAKKLNVLGNKNTSKTLSCSAASSSKHSQNIENGFPNMERGPQKMSKTDATYENHGI